jgi:hypothetical protein
VWPKFQSVKIAVLLHVRNSQQEKMMENGLEMNTFLRQENSRMYRIDYALRLNALAWPRKISLNAWQNALTNTGI